MRISDNVIIVDGEYFDPSATLECGQLFRYGNTAGGRFVVSGDKRCEIKRANDCWTIESDDPEYFFDYFDLGADYKAIIERLSGLPFMDEACAYGKGIRILRQQPFETLISFIVSANNHIPRIKGIIERLCASLGRDCGGYFGFPSPEAMASRNAGFYAEIGAGYRAEYLASAAKAVADGFDLGALGALSTEEAAKRLRSLKGVGPKVADCILLFAYAKTDLFPVDTWVKKIYADIFAEKAADNIIRKKLIELYKNDAGYAQQYLFYRKRELNSPLVSAAKEKKLTKAEK